METVYCPICGGEMRITEKKPIKKKRTKGIYYCYILTCSNSPICDYIESYHAFDKYETIDTVERASKLYPKGQSLTKRKPPIRKTLGVLSIGYYEVKIISSTDSLIANLLLSLQLNKNMKNNKCMYGVPEAEFMPKQSNKPLMKPETIFTAKDIDGAYRYRAICSAK